MSNQILVFIIDTFLGLFSLALLLRFYLQLLRVPFHNPMSQFLIAVTDFIVRPARRFIPGWAGMDLSTLVLAWLMQLLILVSVSLVQGYDFSVNPGQSMLVMSLLALVELISTTCYIVIVMIIVQAILSWVNPNSPVAPMLESFTRPILAVFRKSIPPIANVDLSPLFALILIQLLLMIISGMRMEITSMLIKI